VVILTKSNILREYKLDGQHGLMQLAGDATLMYYLMDEAQEGKHAFLDKRDPDFKQYPKFP
jgi:naphthoate synthase